MNILNITRILIKILAIYAFIKSILTLQMIIYFIPALFQPERFPQYGGNITIFLLVIPFLCLIILATLLWKNAEKYSEKIVKSKSVNKSNQNIEHPIDSTFVENIIFFSIGIIIIVLTLPDLFQYLSNIYTGLVIQRQGFFQAALYPGIARVIGIVLQFLVGLLLVFNSKWFSTLFRKVRSMNNP